MFLSELKLWNFRKFGVGTDVLDDLPPSITVNFNPKLNVLIGENDSGKTAIVDAIRHLLGTQSREWYRLEDSDFSEFDGPRAKRLKIEAVFRDFTSQEAAPFLEWMGFEEKDGEQEYVLTVRLTAERKANRIVAEHRAGHDSVGSHMDGEARELLRITYLKPLRDAESELTPGRRSRLAQILAAHNLFLSTTGQKHQLEGIVENANTEISQYFCHEDPAAPGHEVMRTMNDYLGEFFPDDQVPLAKISISGGDLGDILKRLALALGVNPSGLGSLNLLYMAAELLLLHSSGFQGLRLGAIEELEAHLHPQAQLRLIDFLDDHAADGGKGQFILTTHSTTLGASIDLKNLIVCKGSKVFPMAYEFTNLKPKNYDFLHRFLDSTKANLFFARGVILVEGDAENLLLPTVAEIIGRPLHRYGVSVVNVGSTAFLHYVKIFSRNDGQPMGIPVSVVTDADVKPEEWVDKDGVSPTAEAVEEAVAQRRQWAAEAFDEGEVKAFVSQSWTLEYEIALDSNFAKPFYESILWAEKISNATTGVPQEGKVAEVKRKVRGDFDTWEGELAGDTRMQEKIAFKIYKETMLDKDISKAITAQVVARKLTKVKQKADIADAILTSDSLRYLVDAICHVTKPLDPEDVDDPDF